MTATGSGWERAACMFVLSSGRTGTHTVAGILDTSPHIAAHHEAHPRLVKASFDYHMAGGPAADDRDRWLELVLAARDDLVLNASRRGRIYAETSNRLTYLADLLREAFPASRFVFLHRHPFDVIVSGLRRGGITITHGTSPASCPASETRPRSDGGLTQAERIAWYWARVNERGGQFPTDTAHPKTAWNFGPTSSLMPGLGLGISCSDLPEFPNRLTAACDPCSGGS